MKVKARIKKTGEGQFSLTVPAVHAVRTIFGKTVEDVVMGFYGQRHILIGEFEIREYTAVSLLAYKRERFVRKIQLMGAPKMIRIDELVTAYALLEELLADNKWELADAHTYEVQLLIVEREDFGSWSDLYPDFPCQDLRAIDELWTKYSQGRFGYSVQKQIYKQFTGRSKYTKFCEAIGLRSQGRWIYPPTYTLDAPLGHLPYFSTGLSRGKQDVRWWFEHLEECGL